MTGRSKKKAMLMVIAGVCFLIPAMRYYYLQGFPGFGAGVTEDMPVVSAAQLLAGILLLVRAFIDMRKLTSDSACRPEMRP